MVGLILVGIARCIAMVLVWNQLAQGSSEYAAGLVALNSIFSDPHLRLLRLGVHHRAAAATSAWRAPSCPSTIGEIFASVMIYLGIPFAAGVLSRLILVPLKGAAWYDRVFIAAHLAHHARRAAVHHRGDVLDSRASGSSQLPLDVRAHRDSRSPLYFAIMFLVSFFMAWQVGADYPRSATLAFTAARQQLRAGDRRRHRGLRHLVTASHSPPWSARWSRCPCSSAWSTSVSTFGAASTAAWRAPDGSNAALRGVDDHARPAPATTESAPLPAFRAPDSGSRSTALLAPASEALVAALPVERASHLGGALQFFFYDTPKVLLLLTGVVFVMGMVNTLSSRRSAPAPCWRAAAEGVGNVMAAGAGHRHAVLFLLGRAAVHRLRLRPACRWA